jgi:hypothetical protein
MLLDGSFVTAIIMLSPSCAFISSFFVDFDRSFGTLLLSDIYLAVKFCIIKVVRQYYLSYYFGF